MNKLVESVKKGLSNYTSWKKEIEDEVREELAEEKVVRGTKEYTMLKISK